MSANPTVAVTQNPLEGSSLSGAAVTGTSVCNIGVSGTSVPYASAAAQEAAAQAATAAGKLLPAPTLGDGVYGSGRNGVHGISMSGNAADSGVLGENTTGAGVTGSSSGGHGVYGETTHPTSAGVAALNNSAFPCVAISGSSAHGHGIYGCNQTGAGSGAAPTRGCGVWGESDQGYGAYGASNESTGVFGASVGADGVHGETQSQTGFGVSAVNNSAFPCVAISGSSASGHGVQGRNQTGGASAAAPSRGCGVWGESNQGYGVYGASVSSSGVYGTSGSGYAGEFHGNVSVSGTLAASDVTLTGGDCAEQFDAAGAEAIEPGTVLVINDDGTLRQSGQAYDRRVAGVVSGAGAFKPGIVLDRRADTGGRTTIALIGKTYCKVDAGFGAIGVGDLLTTSPTPGCAMRASDPMKAFGAVIGKALAPIGAGRGLIPILVALQ